MLIVVSRNKCCYLKSICKRCATFTGCWPAPSKGSATFADRFKVATFISRYDDEHVLMSVPINKRGFRYAHLRKIRFDKRGVKPNGTDIYVSEDPQIHKYLSHLVLHLFYQI